MCTCVLNSYLLGWTNRICKCLSLPHLTKKRKRQASVGKVTIAPKANWMDKECGFLHNEELVAGVGAGGPAEGLCRDRHRRQKDMSKVGK